MNALCIPICSGFIDDISKWVGRISTFIDLWARLFPGRGDTLFERSFLSYIIVLKEKQRQS